MAHKGEEISSLSQNKFKWLGNDKAIVSIVFDDGESSLWQNARGILASRGLPWNLAISTEVFMQQNPSNGFMTVEQLKTLHAEGVEILSHSALHTEFTNSYDVKWSESQLRESKEAIKKLGINANGFVAPVGNVASKHIPNIVNNFDYSFMNYAYQTYTPVNKEVSHAIPRMSFASDYASIQGWINQAITNKDFIVIWAHNVNDSDVSVSNFTTLMDFIKSKVDQGTLEVKTLKKAYTDHSTMFAKESSALDMKSDPVVLKASENRLFNPKFNSAGKGWVQSKSNNAATIFPQAVNAKYVFILDNVALADWAEVSQKVETDFKQNVVASVRANILSNTSTTVDSADLRIILRLFNGSTLVRELSQDTQLYPTTAGYEVESKFNLPYLSSYKHTHVEMKFRFIKRKAENVRFELQYPYLEFLSPKSPPENNHPALNVSVAGGTIVLNTTIAMDTDYFKFVFPGQVVEYDNVSSGSYTVSKTGIYEISSVMQVQGGTSSSGVIRFIPLINGTRQSHDTFSINLANGAKETIVFRNFLSLQAGDVIELQYTKNFPDLSILVDSDIVVKK
ncbi:polysaccharide deacetylase family protein [Jeotgalibacillus proteolyticus]|uniref:polysaccharide deacetylase family protein n=1 Tax=Jeotgalibacillus proteolyticus TaxID=2082395 RepID=UPI003CED9B8B